MKTTSFLLGLTLLCALPAAPGLAAGPPLPDCTCRGFGGDMPLGAQLCIVTPDGKRLATCVKEQNVTSWRPTSENCNEVSQVSPRRLANACGLGHSAPQPL